MNIRFRLLKTQSLRLWFQMSQVYYAVARGRKVGIYKTWAECNAQVVGFSFPKYRKFPSESEAQTFIDQNRLEISPPTVKLSSQNSIRNFHGAPSPSKFPDKTLSTSAEKSPKSNFMKRNLSMSATQRSPKSKSSIKQELQSLKYDSSKLKERLKNFVQEQEALINNIDQRIDGIINILDDDDEGEGEISSPPPAKKRNIEADEDKASQNQYFDCEDFDYLDVAQTTSSLEGLVRDENGFVHVYTDGSCENNGKKGARAGCGIFWADGHSWNRGQPASRATNNAAEIEAITEAVKTANAMGIHKLKIHTDSKFAIQCVTEWMPGWKKKGWKTAEGKPVKNRVELEVLDQAIKESRIEISWQHVRGHIGIHGNERADALARLGAESYVAQK